MQLKDTEYAKSMQLLQRKALLFTVLLTYHVVSCGEPCDHGTTPSEKSAICTATLTDERTLIKTFNTSIVAPIVAGVGGSISCLSSVLIIVFIIRSKVGFSTLYHRIMSVISIGDLLLSIGAAASTLPMPKDMIYEQFQGDNLGNNFTCNMQGFLMWFGNTLSLLYSGILALYFLFVIKYKMKESQLSKYVEIAIHFFIIMFALEAPVLMWVNDRFNPTPLRPWCTACGYPWYCKLNRNPEECMLRGNLTTFAKNTRLFHVKKYTIILFGTFLIIVVAMSCIVWSVYNHDRILNEYTDTVYGRSTSNAVTEMRLKSATQRNKHCKVVTRVALAYVLSCALTQGSALLNTGEVSLEVTNKTSSLRWTLQFFVVFLSPLQGFFNAIIFFAQKLYERHYVSGSGMTFKEVMTKLFREPEEQMFVISQISLVIRRQHHMQSPGHNEVNACHYSFHGDDEENGQGNNDSEEFEDDEGISPNEMSISTSNKQSSSSKKGNRNVAPSCSQGDEGLSYEDSSSPGISSSKENDNKSNSRSSIVLSNGGSLTSNFLLKNDGDNVSMSENDDKKENNSESSWKSLWKSSWNSPSSNFSAAVSDF